MNDRDDIVGPPILRAVSLDEDRAEAERILRVRPVRVARLAVRGELVAPPPAGSTDVLETEPAPDGSPETHRTIGQLTELSDEPAPSLLLQLVSRLELYRRRPRLLGHDLARPFRSVWFHLVEWPRIRRRLWAGVPSSGKKRIAFAIPEGRVIRAGTVVLHERDGSRWRTVGEVTGTSAPVVHAWVECVGRPSFARWMVGRLVQIVLAIVVVWLVLVALDVLFTHPGSP